MNSLERESVSLSMRARAPAFPVRRGLLKLNLTHYSSGPGLALLKSTRFFTPTNLYARYVENQSALPASARSFVQLDQRQ
jgi:hypothetical protein